MKGAEEMSDESMSLPGRFAVYGTVNGKPSVVARFEDNDVWLTQKQLADLFNTTKQNISQHLKAIYESGELSEASTVKKFFTMDENAGQVAKMTFKGDYVTRDDVRIAKNYLAENELSRLNLLVSQFLDFAEYKALSEEPMSMKDWISALDDQLKRLRARLLVGKGSVSHDAAIEKAEHEFEIYRQREMRQLKSDFDKAVKGYLGNDAQ